MPFGRRDVPSPLVWPAAAAVSTLLVSRSQLASWELRSGRRLWPRRLALVVAFSGANALAALAVAPPDGRVALLTWHFLLQAVSLGCAVLCGELGWLPLTALTLVAMFELAQDGSLVLRAVTASTYASLAVTSAAFALLAAVASSDRGQRRGRE